MFIFSLFLQKNKQMHTPNSISCILKSNLRIPDTINNQIELKGRYKKNGTKDYNGFYFDTLIDENTEESIVIKVSKDIRDQLENDYIYSFTGVLVISNKKDCLFHCYLSVTDTTAKLERRISTKEEQILKLLEKKSGKKTSNISIELEDILLKNIKPKICLLFPQRTEVRTEFWDALGSGINMYDCHEIQCNFGNIQEFTRCIDSLDSQKYDAIFILRGGGEGLDFFSNCEVINCILECNTPIFSGVGHGDSNILLRSFVSEYKNNPTDTGHHLAKLAESTRKRVEDQFESNKNHNNMIKDKDTIIEAQKAQIDELKKNKMIYILATAATVAITLFMLIG